MGKVIFLIDCIYCVSLIVYVIAAISGHIDADPWEVLSAILKISGYVSVAAKALRHRREM